MHRVLKPMREGSQSLQRVPGNFPSPTRGQPRASASLSPQVVAEQHALIADVELAAVDHRVRPGRLAAPVGLAGFGIDRTVHEPELVFGHTGPTQYSE